MSLQHSSQELLCPVEYKSVSELSCKEFFEYLKEKGRQLEIRRIMEGVECSF